MDQQIRTLEMWGKKQNNEPPNKDQRIDATSPLTEKVNSILDQVFAHEFRAPAKKIREITHVEQAKCFAQSVWSLAESEKCARDTMLPYLQLRRLNQELTAPCHEDLSMSDITCLEGSKTQAGYDECIQEKGLKPFTACIDSKKDIMRRYYNDHIRNFKEIVKMGAQSRK